MTGTRAAIKAARSVVRPRGRDAGGTQRSMAIATVPRVSLTPSRLLDIAVPRRLGNGFRWLLSATVIDNVGDGIALAAGPLLVASQTRDPFLVSMALMAQFVPGLLFGVLGGVAADRFDRRRVVIVVNLVRAAVLAVLVATIATGTVNIALVLGVLFILGTAETFADAASHNLLPRLVARADLSVANSRMQGAFLLTNQLVAPPIGAFLFAAGMALPFATNAAAFCLGALLISRIQASFRAERQAGSSVRRDVVEGIRWLVAHPPMRTLALTVFTFNVTYGAAWGVLVLYALERLGMDEVGFGLLTTAGAIGGVLGILSYGALERRIGLGGIMRGGLLVETATHLVLALTTSPPVALLVMVLFGWHAFMWGTTATTVRQRAVPDHLLGRVGSAYQVASMGGLIIGVPLGGLLAGAFDITAPFWFGFVGSALLVVLLWRQFSHIAHAAEA